MKHTNNDGYSAIRLKRLPVSFMIQKQAMIVMLILSIILISISLISLSTGTIKIGMDRIFQTFIGSGTDIENFTILTLRLPRIILGILAGVGLSLSGAILQGLIRNPLAGPDVIGVNSGASLMAVIFITLFADTVSIHFLPFFAFFGAVLVVFFMYGLSWKNGVTPLRLILIGFGVKALLGAVQRILMLSGTMLRTSQAYTWLAGSLYATKWYEVQIVSIWMLILIPLLIVAVKSLNMQQVSDEITVSLGGRLQIIRLGLISLAACLAGIIIAFTGGIGFIGLMSPHIARKLVGTTYGQLLPCSALIGAILIVVSDWIGRTWFAPVEIAVGVFTSLLGAPFFIYLFIKMRNK
ncbi:iron complex transport system permease protein [Natranaerovirga hydrolytica]|uniref:Iron complex transport system permease protein n=1 Tax=Natranaerovirga hydrolytica TaxID=680378 RepID=A0A4R1MPK1_9FIRM|nr:iron ABC transporter permease [Natranaerovirga hydrolytica]TCK92409.1 iron complex transport system permease protein [Natranaerovirga hydrolytica]